MKLKPEIFIHIRGIIHEKAVRMLSDPKSIESHSGLPFFYMRGSRGKECFSEWFSSDEASVDIKLTNGPKLNDPCRGFLTPRITHVQPTKSSVRGRAFQGHQQDAFFLFSLSSPPFCLLVHPSVPLACPSVCFVRSTAHGSIFPCFTLH